MPVDRPAASLPLAGGGEDASASRSRLMRLATWASMAVAGVLIAFWAPGRERMPPKD